MTIETTIQKLQDFANKHEIVLQVDGQCGFGRDCVGFSHGNNWVAHNPIHMETFEPIPEFESEDIRECAPEDAYAKWECLAVLVETDREKAIAQLAQWVDDLEEIGVDFVHYPTGARGIQAQFSGTHGFAVRPAITG